MTSRLQQRLSALERDRRSDPASWWGLPLDEWPDGAIVAFLAEKHGWPPGYEPTDAELESFLAEGDAV